MGEGVARDVDRFESELVREAGKLYPGALEALRELRAWVAQMAICANGQRPYVQAVLDGYSLARFFDAVRLPESDCDRKPSMVRDLPARLAARVKAFSDRYLRGKDVEISTKTPNRP